MLLNFLSHITFISRISAWQPSGGKGWSVSICLAQDYNSFILRKYHIEKQRSTKFACWLILYYHLTWIDVFCCAFLWKARIIDRVSHKRGDMIPLQLRSNLKPEERNSHTVQTLQNCIAMQRLSTGKSSEAIGYLDNH